MGSQAFIPSIERSALTWVKGFIARLRLKGYASPFQSCPPAAPMPRILLAEDDDSLRGFLARALERAGYDVVACADGDEAAAVLDQDWDLLLTDIVMPGMDGMEVARQAAARHPGLRLMFITGFAAVALAAG